MAEPPRSLDIYTSTSSEGGTNSEDVHLASLACSPISPAGEASQAALSSYADVSRSPDTPGQSSNRHSSTVFQENINRDSVTEPSVQPSSPMSQPSPTPKPHKSGSNPPVKMLSSTDVPEMASSPEGTAPKDGATRTLTSVGSAIRKQEKPHLLPMRPLRLPTSSSTRVLKISNLPWSITCQALIEWLGENLQKALPPVGFQVISVHILCDRYIFCFLSLTGLGLFCRSCLCLLVLVILLPYLTRFFLSGCSQAQMQNKMSSLHRGDISQGSPRYHQA